GEGLQETRLKQDVYYLEKPRRKTEALIFGSHDSATLEMTQRIRQLGLTLPVVGVTANALAEEKQRCLESGMDSCLSKPVT
ncbi:hypothetical protein KU735_24930, partial [Salmonella enterica subsp. enterica serovar Give]|nr:hypothetical protein [Salmonella enterica subsp. enterica serovar Give]